MTSTHTYVVLEISPEAHAEIKAKLLAAGYSDQIHGDTIDMHGIAVEPLVGKQILSFEEDRRYRSGIELSRAVLGEQTIEVTWPETGNVPLKSIREYYPEGVSVDRQGNVSGDPKAIESFKEFCRHRPILLDEEAYNRP